MNDYRYLIKNKRLLVQYLACNLLPKDYVFYRIFFIPADKDPLLIDAKLILTYETYHSKSTVYRRKKAGIASVKYLRVGSWAMLIATKGKSLFLDREPWLDARENPIVVGGYSLTVNKGTGKVSVRLHREAQNRLKRFILEWSVRRSREWWEAWIRKFPFLPFAGVRDNLFVLIRFLNANRKSFRQLPVDWKRCVRKKFQPEPSLLETPPEILELLRFESKKR